MLLEGYLDRCDAELVAGWVMDWDDPSRPVALELRAGGTRIAQGLANLFRADLKAAGKAEGRHGFQFATPKGIDPAGITIAIPGTARRFAGPRQGLSGLALPDRPAPPPAARRFRRCLLHIGTEKTGSTTLQLFLAANREALARAGFFVPTSLVRPPGQDGASSWALTAYARDDAILHDDAMRTDAGLRDAAGLARFRADIAARLDAEIAAAPAHCDTLLLSSEHCHSTLHSVEEVAAARQLLEPHCAGYRVLAYLRPQIELALSAHAMLVKDGEIDMVQLPAFGPRTATDKLPFAYFDYAAMLHRWAEVFGTPAVSVRRYLRGALRNGDIVDDYLDWIGLPDGGFARPRSANASLSAGGQDLLAALTRALRDWPAEDAAWVRQWMVPRLLHGATGPWRLPPRAEAAAFMARFDASNEAVRATWFPALDRLFDIPLERYPEQAEPPGAMPPAMLDTLIRVLLVERSWAARKLPAE
jgi:hypothetical protein